MLDGNGGQCRVHDQWPRCLAVLGERAEDFPMSFTGFEDTGHPEAAIATPKLQSLSRRSGRALGCECRELRGEFHILGNPARGRSFHVAPQYPTREGGLLAGSSAVDPADQIVPKASRPPTRHSVTPSLTPTRLLQAGQKRTRWTPDSQNVDGIPCDETARTGATRTLNLRVGGSIPPPSPRLTTNTEEINTGSTRLLVEPAR